MQPINASRWTMRQSTDGYLLSIEAIGLLRTWLSCLTVISDEAGVGIPCPIAPTALQAVSLLLPLLVLSFPVGRYLSKVKRGPVLAVAGVAVSLFYFSGALLGLGGIVSTAVCIGFFPVALAVWGHDNRCANFGTVVTRIALSFFVQYLAYATIVFLPCPARVFAVGLLPMAVCLLLAKPPTAFLENGGAEKGSGSRTADILLLASMALCAAGHGVLASVSPNVGPVWYLGTLLMGALLVLVRYIVNEGALLRSILFVTLLFQCVFVIPALVFPSVSEWIILARSFSYAVSIGLACALGCWVGGRRGNGGVWVSRFMAIFIGVFYVLYLPMLSLPVEPTIRYFVMFFCFVVATIPALAPDLASRDANLDDVDIDQAGDVSVAGEQFDLTQREREVLGLMVEGLSADEIASKLVVSKNTVRSQTQSIYRKLDAHNRDEVAAKVRGLQRPAM